MSRRQRVPRHKGHRRKRNKNPKLSPFQREQRRERLANQVPTTSLNSNQRDYPVSQRAVLQFIAAQREKQEERRRQRETATVTDKERVTVTATEQQKERDDVEKRDRRKGKKRVLGAMESEDTSTLFQVDQKTDARVMRVETEATKQNKKKKNTTAVPPMPLNAQFAASLAKPIMAFRTLTEKEDNKEHDDSVEAIVARKKEKKHRRKVVLRRERTRQMLHEMEEQLKQEIHPAKAGKKRMRASSVDAKDAAFERELKKMQKEKAAMEQAAKKASSKKNVGATGSDTKKKRRLRKHITFSDGESDATKDTPYHVMRFPNDKGNTTPRDFYELVDPVRFGERVEAPPVFDALPSRNTSITRLAQHLEKSSQCTAETKTKKNMTSSQTERLRLLSSMGGVGEQKRLQRLGLTPMNRESPATTAVKKFSREAEMNQLRERVMEAYRRNRHAQIRAQKGVDMQHQFPRFS